MWCPTLVKYRGCLSHPSLLMQAESQTLLPPGLKLQPNKNTLLALLVQRRRPGKYLLLRKLLLKGGHILRDDWPRGRLEVLNAGGSVSTITSGFFIKDTSLYGILRWKDGEVGVLLFRHGRWWGQTVESRIWNESKVVRHFFFPHGFSSLFQFPFYSFHLLHSPLLYSP